MKKLVMVVVMAMMLSGCGKVKEERNYFFTNLRTGEQLWMVTQSEYMKLMGLYEHGRHVELQDLMDELKLIDEVYVTWDEDLRNESS